MAGPHKGNWTPCLSRTEATLSSCSRLLLSLKAKASTNPLPQLQRSGHRAPTRYTTSLQGEEEVTVALQLLHELLVLQEECDPLILQVLLPAALRVPGPRPGRREQASLSTCRLRHPGASLRRGTCGMAAHKGTHCINTHAHLGVHVSFPRTLCLHAGACTSYLNPVISQNPP